MKKLNGLIPTIIQDARNGLVLMLGYMNSEALKKTIATGNVWFYSRSKKRLWMKGEKSGNILQFIDAKLDCDKDALLVKAVPSGPTCHKGTNSCFNQNNRNEDVFSELYSIILDRKKNKPKESYTAFLIQKGFTKICEKIAEESDEVIKAAKKESKKRLVEESADLLYHLFVLLASKDIEFLQFLSEIKKRRK